MGYIASFSCKVIIGGKLCTNHVDVLVIPDEVFQSIGNGNVHNYGSPRELNEAADTFVHNTLGITSVDWRGCALWRQSVDATQYSAALANMYAIVPTVYDVGLTLEDNTYVNGTGTNKNGTYPLGCFQRRNYGTYLAEGSLGTTTGAQNSPKNAISGSNPRVAVERDGSFDITIPVISDYSFVDGKLDFSKIAARGSGRFTVGYNSSYTSNPWIWRCQTKISAGASDFTTWDGYPLFNEAKPHEMGTPYDPYEPGGYTDPEGETEEPNPDDVPNQTPSDQPSNVNDLAAGLYRCYAMTASELATFGAKLWKPSVLQSLRNHIQQPLDLVMGLKSYPFEIPGGTAEEIHFNWIDDVDIIWGSGVYGHPISGNGIKTLTFGHIDVPRVSDTFYDYQPFSSAELHLPYIGFVPLKMNEIVGRSIIITYKIDLFSGDFTAWLTMGTTDDYDNHYNRKVFGYYQGNIAKAIPIRQQDMWQVYKKGVEIAFDGAKAIGSLATGSLARGAALSHAHQAETLMTGGNPNRSTAALEMAGEEWGASEKMFHTFKRSGTDTINAAIDMSYVSSPIERNGVIDGSSGRTSSQQCFLLLTSPDQSVPENQSILGYPSNIPGPLSKVSGYTEVREIRLHSGIASESELNELEAILRGGIVI